MDSKEVRERLNWSLEQKIDHSVGVVEDFIARTGREPFVSFSGGKDSTVLLDLVRRFIRQDIKAVFCNTGNEYPETIRFVRDTENVVIIRPKKTIKQVIESYGFPLVSKEQARYIRDAKTTRSDKLRALRMNGNEKGSGKIYEKWKFLIYAPFDVSEKCCDVLKKEPLKRYAHETGELPIIGTMIAERTLRRWQYIRRGGCNSFDERRQASYPLSIWAENDIWEYIRKFKVRYNPLYDIEGVERTGCMVCGFGAHFDTERFVLLESLHPKAYDTFMAYTNNGVTYRQALRAVGVVLPEDKLL